MNTKYGIIAALLACCPTLLGQSAQYGQSFTIEANVSRSSNGILTITANNSRPLWQALESVRKRYGWTVDYEDSPNLPQVVATVSAQRHVMRLMRGGTLVLQIKEPANNSVSEEQRVLKEVVDQYNANSAIKYRVLKISNFRFDVAPAVGSVLDQPVTIDDNSRSLRAEVDAIMASLTKKTGIAAVQGGLINNSMEQVQISLKHANPTPARQLLNEVLNRAPDEKVWVFTYDPSGGYFGIGIQTTEKWFAGQNGKTAVRIFPNPYFISAK